MDALKRSIMHVKEPVSMLLLTLTLTAVTYKSIFYEIGPSTIDASIWINATTLVMCSCQFIGVSLGNQFRLNFFIHSFEWFPWFYNVVIVGVFIWNSQAIYDQFWGLFWPLLILLSFRCGFVITYYQSKIAANNPNDPNCVIIGNLSTTVGVFFGSIIGLFVLMIKDFVHRT